MTQYELIPMLIGFGVLIFFGILIYYIRHLQNSHAKERGKLVIAIEDWKNKFLDLNKSAFAAKKETEAERDEFKKLYYLSRKATSEQFDLRQEADAKVLKLEQDLNHNAELAEKLRVERDEWKEKADSLADTKRLLELELNDREHHEAIIDQQNAMIIELKDMVKNLIEKGKEIQKEKLEEALRILEEETAEVGVWMNPNYTGGFNHPRPISSLKPNEAIQVNNDAERDGILKLMEAEGWEWMSGISASKLKPNREYPYCIHFSEIYKGVAHERIGYMQTHKTILPASDFLPVEQPVESTRDWNVPQVFPNDYKIPKNTRVVKITKDDHFVKKGSIGVTKEESYIPYIKWENKDYDLKGDKKDHAQIGVKLAPINPTDHPEHPQFKGKK